MNMTREEIIKQYEMAVEGGELIAPFMGEDAKEIYEMLKAGLSALRPITREQVRRGEWEKIGADYRGQGGIWKCTACGKTYPYKCDFCPNCGAPMTDKAVDMVMERLETINNA